MWLVWALGTGLADVGPYIADQSTLKYDPTIFEYELAISIFYVIEKHTPTSILLRLDSII